MTKLFSWALLAITLALNTSAHADVLSKCIELLNVSNVGTTAAATGEIKEIPNFDHNQAKLVPLLGEATADADSGTNPTLALAIQSCRDKGDPTTCDNRIDFTACTTGSCFTDGRERKDVVTESQHAFPYFRAVGTIGGTNPVYDIQVLLCFK